MFKTFNGVPKWRSLTHKRIYMAWSYGASPIGLAKRHGWRKVREVIKATFNRPNNW